jgi:hypothetical protein
MKNTLQSIRVSFMIANEWLDVGNRGGSAAAPSPASELHRPFGELAWLHFFPEGTHASYIV